MTWSAPEIDRTAFRESARERAVGRLVRARLYVVPVLGTLALTFAFFEPTPWRKAVLYPAVAMLFVLSCAEWVRHLVHGVNALTVPLNVGVMSVAQIGIAFATGGLFSPAIAGMVLVATLAAVFAQTSTVYLFVGLLQVPAIWLMAWVHGYNWPVATLIPRLFGDAGALEHGLAPWLVATLYTLLFGGAVQIGALLRNVFGELFDEAIGERDRALAMHAEQARTLTALSAELAHELKNPLASVKGLSALVARQAQGKAAERLAVLRGEVDRMHGILDELLDFSRPLVPLMMEDVELTALASEVARLYEATAAERAVALRISADAPVRLRCDPRKIRQVLINLIQNALDASSCGGAVDITVAALPASGVAEARARLVVIDHGAGIDPDLAGRLFEPGVTTKEHGSGLGLVVARSLASQHGGELSLRAGAAGGAVAELILPRDLVRHGDPAPPGDRRPGSTSPGAP